MKTRRGFCKAFRDPVGGVRQKTMHAHRPGGSAEQIEVGRQKGRTQQLCSEVSWWTQRSITAAIQGIISNEEEVAGHIVLSSHCTAGCSPNELPYRVWIKMTCNLNGNENFISLKGFRLLCRKSSSGRHYLSSLAVLKPKFMQKSDLLFGNVSPSCFIGSLRILKWNQTEVCPKCYVFTNMHLSMGAFTWICKYTITFVYKMHVVIDIHVLPAHTSVSWI